MNRLRPLLLLSRLLLIFFVLVSHEVKAADSELEWREMSIAVEFDPGRAISQGKHALQQARAKGDKPAELNALLLLSRAYANIGETPNQPEDEERGFVLARELGDMGALCWYLDGKAWVNWDEGRLDEANALWDEAIAIAERHKLDTRRAWLYANRGASLDRAGRKGEAMAWHAKAYSLFEANQDGYGMALALAHIGNTYAGPEAYAQDQARAADYYRRALDLLDPQVYRRITAELYIRLGLSHYRRNNIPEARKLLEQGLALVRTMGFPNMEAQAEFFLAHVYKDERRFVEALALMDKATALYRKSDFKPMLGRANVARAELLAALGRKKESLEALGAAKAMFAEMNTPPIAVYFYTATANTYAWLGDYPEAYRQMQAARDADRRMAEALNTKLGDELRVRFDVRLKDAENVLLRSQKKEAESRRLALSLALALTLLLLGSAAFYLHRRAAAARMQAAHERELANAEASRAQTLQTANATLEQLATVGREITSSLQADRVFDALYHNAGVLLDASSLSIWVVQEDRIVQRFGMQDGEALPEMCVDIDNAASRIARCVRERSELLLEFAPGPDDASDNTVITRTALFAPLVVGPRVLGVLLFQSSRHNAYGERERQIVRTLTAYGAVATSNATNAQQLVAASQAKSTFLANMSHELRSPLNAMLGFTQLLLRDATLADTVRDDLSIVLRSGKHLHTLINQVLDLSKIEAGRTTLNEFDVDVYELLDELADTYSIMAAQKGLQLVIDNEPDVPKTIRTDGVKLRQVLINLIGNAMKFTGEGGVSLAVAVKSHGVSACVLSFAVSDTGVGIAPEELSKLGGAFIQAKAGQQAQEGTGLGLAISSSFVRLMGGELRFSSRLGQGTTISFELPVQFSEASAGAAAQIEEPRVRALAPNQPHYRVLVVDDSVEARQLLSRLLSPLGFVVREAGNGEEAIAVWRDWYPHLVLMDIRMPVMDGREAARRIKASEKGSETLIIALTASSFEQECEQILADGCDDFLGKPFREQALFELMQKHLGAQFVYDAPSAASIMQAPESDAMAVLPEDLLAELARALRELDVDAVERRIEAVRGHDDALANQLVQMASRYQYGEILELIDKKIPAVAGSDRR
jgi:signal transduction histidine kinase/DNA-binding NarL/FixJ family response regulator/tetratricopeptide (TPR) repeat protein